MNTPRDFPLPSSHQAIPWRQNGFVAELGPAYFKEVAPQALPSPHWVAQSDDLANELGLTEWLQTEEGLWALSGSLPPQWKTPLATAYSGHQFGVWAGPLGDGRALLLGELDSAAGPQEIQLKGSGLTPFSRMGDGRAVLRSSIREFLCSEAMYGLGVPTTRALAIVGSPQPVLRETIETAAVVTRVAPSFLRFGHFEHYCHSTRNVDHLRHLTDATLARFFPQYLEAPPGAARYGPWLDDVARRTAELMARWQSLGFCHGVMNTDNMSILGLTIDYGPFGFMDAFDPGHVCNHSDHHGRYAWARQPQVAYWNLLALARAVQPLFEHAEEADSAVEAFKTTFAEAWMGHLGAKLGLSSSQPSDNDLIHEWLELMARQRADFTLAFRGLSQVRRQDLDLPAALGDLFVDREALKAWTQRYRSRLMSQPEDDAQRAVRMNLVNPKFVLRNHLAENAIQAARAGDFSEVSRLQTVLRRPFDEQPEAASYAALPPAWAQDLEISCSS